MSWIAPASNGSAITRFVVLQSAGGDYAPAVAEIAASGTQASVTSLANGTAYRFKVQAINDVGAGPVSDASAVMTTPDVSAAPSISASAKVATAGSAGLIASVPALTGLSYRWTIAGGAITSPGGVQGVLGSGIDSIVFTAGDVGTATVTCVAGNEVGSSAPGSATVDVVAPPAIQSFAASATSASVGDSVTLTGTFTGGTGAIGPGVGAAQSGVSISSGSLHANTTFTLTVTNLAGASTSATTAVSVTSFTRAAPPMKAPRFFHTATTLPGGKVLVVSGAGESSAELYDASGSAWTGSLHAVRYQHTATLLHDGTVLVAGGRSNGTGPLGSPFPTDAEIYDPGTGSFAITRSGLSTGRTQVPAALLADGRVLFAGGFGDDGYGCCNYLKTVELYDPALRTFSATGSLARGRKEHTATTLADGRVLVAGGFTGNAEGTAELFDPASGSFAAGPPMRTPRFGHAAVLLLDGRVLVISGLGPPFTNGAGGTLTTSAELYDARSEAFVPAGDLHVARYDPEATLLPDGRVLVTGGQDQAQNAFDSAELYDPATNTFALVSGKLSVPRTHHALALLPNGFVAILGGWTSGQPATATVDEF